MIHAVPADQVQVHPAASQPIDFPIFVAGTEIVVEGDKIVEVTSPGGRKILQLNSEEGRKEEEYQHDYQETSSSNLSPGETSQSYRPAVEAEAERGQYDDPHSGVEMVLEDNDLYNRVEVDVIMLEDSHNISPHQNMEGRDPLNVGLGGKFVPEENDEAGNTEANEDILFG